MTKNKEKKVKSKHTVQLSDVEKQISRAIYAKQHGNHGKPSKYSWADCLKFNGVLMTWILAHGLIISNVQREPSVLLPFWCLLRGYGINEITEEDKRNIVDDFLKD